MRGRARFQLQPQDVRRDPFGVRDHCRFDAVRQVGADGLDTVDVGCAARQEQSQVSIFLRQRICRGDTGIATGRLQHAGPATALATRERDRCALAQHGVQRTLARGNAAGPVLEPDSVFGGHSLTFQILKLLGPTLLDRPTRALGCLSRHLRRRGFGDRVV
jgi:hypothetical protein